MIKAYDDLTVGNIAPLAFEDPERAVRLLRDLAGHDISDDRFEQLLPLLTDSLKRCADPDRALRNLAAWLDRSGSRSLYYSTLTSYPAAVDAVITLFAASQFFADILLRNPEYFEVIANPAIRDRSRSFDDYLSDGRRRIAVAKSSGAKGDALRRFKPPEVLRIGAQDILSWSDLPGTVQEISDFAQACVQLSVEINGAGDKFAVIGMGKLGGRELNYASDIDLIFVHDDDLPQQRATAFGEAVRDTLAKVTDAGFLFRVDLRLRPEGRFGPLSRSLSSCRAYYESWAEPWERQAMLKARFIAGDAMVGGRFIQIIEPFVFHKRVEQHLVDEIRGSKRQIERKVERSGHALSNVKEGIGGIRDIEFAVQLLQLLAGGQNPSVRTGSTLVALQKLAEIGLMSADERDQLRKSYIFLRDVEHRLQVMDERPIRDLPLGSAREMDKFGRRLGFADGAAFLTSYRAHTELVHRLFEQLFYGSKAVARGSEQDRDVQDWVRAFDDPAAQLALVTYLGSRGFIDKERALAVLKRSQAGNDYGQMTPEAREQFANLAPRLIDASARTSAPDTALASLDILADAMPSRSAFLHSLVDQGDLVERLCRLAAESPYLFQQVIQYPEYLDRLNDEQSLLDPSMFATPKSQSDIPKALAGYIRRERLRLGAADIWELLTPQAVSSQLTNMAEQAILAALHDASLHAGPAAMHYRLAVIGLGKLGGFELGYGSDLDVLWVTPAGVSIADANPVAEAAMRLLRDGLKSEGISYEIDARLRPDGRVGPLVRTIDSYQEYYTAQAQTWELQSLLKARFVAGDTEVGREFVDQIRSLVYREPLSDEQLTEMRHMKQRIEKERSKGAADLKLGPGGLSDIEWVAQRLQWQWGKRWPRAKQPGTIPALTALRDAGVVRQDDWEILTSAYAELTLLRNRLWLRDGRGADVASEQGTPIIQMRAAVRAVFERLMA